MPDLSVKVNHRDIIVSKPSVGLSVTYRKHGRILEAIEPIRIRPSAEELTFYGRTWKAAFGKAQSLGWLYSSFGGHLCRKVHFVEFCNFPSSSQSSTSSSTINALLSPCHRLHSRQPVSRSP
jgi:hypothetical protein